MDQEETKCCPNCKREIPAVNYTIHSVHCARNIKICPVCKEPVPGSELDDHHQKYHKLLPCKQCGESVCGTDLEDHIRDSCAHTIKTCRFCELELPRRELPAHEGYCGVRTEQCSDCGEWVMIKYRQLHLDSNHGFIRLADDPAPSKKEPIRVRPGQCSANMPPPAATRAKSTNVSAANELPRPTSIFNDAGPSNYRNDFPRTVIRYTGSSGSSSASSSSASPQERPVTNGVKKRTNDQPQINTHKEVANKVDKDLPISRGAVKKRPAPKAPRAAPADPRRDNAYYSAMHRQQKEERERREQNEYNLAHGLPPVLNPAAKLDKLRKMDALHNRETEQEYRDRLRRPSPEPRDEPGRNHQDLRNLKPMSPEQFMARFSEMQLREERSEGDVDRFPEIKSSLRELRRGLKEVTAPYNNNNNNANNNNERAGGGSPREELRLPCEFCDILVPAEELVQHQTGCRPDLAQYWGGARAASPPPPASPHADPLIPCEFCAQSLPVYLITEHQEQCARGVDILSTD